MNTERLHKLFWGLSLAGAVALSPLAAAVEQEGMERIPAPDTGPAIDEPIPDHETERMNDEFVDTEPSQKLMDAIRERDDLNKVAGILESVDLENIIDSERSHTFFLPNDDAFDDLDEEIARRLTEESGPTELEALLRGHIVQGVYRADALSDEKAQSLAAHQIEGTRDLMFRRAVRPVDAEGEAVGERTRLVETDIEVAEGIIHVVNKVWYQDGPETVDDDPFADRAADESAGNIEEPDEDRGYAEEVDDAYGSEE